MQKDHRRSEANPEIWKNTSFIKLIVLSEEQGSATVMADLDRQHLQRRAQPFATCVPSGATANVDPLIPEAVKGLGSPPAISCKYNRIPLPGALPENTNCLPFASQRARLCETLPPAMVFVVPTPVGKRAKSFESGVRANAHLPSGESAKANPSPSRTAGEPFVSRMKAV